MPLVSVVIPTYNSAQYIPEAVDSILSQTFKDFEIIVVDDGSTDNTEEVVTRIKSDKVRYFKQPNSGGPSKPRNVGVELARGNFISLCDSDDVIFPNKLAEAVDFFLQHPHLGFVFANMVLCYERFTALLLEPISCTVYL